jgi:hypothetical protein
MCNNIFPALKCYSSLNFMVLKAYQHFLSTVYCNTVLTVHRTYYLIYTALTVPTVLSVLTVLTVLTVRAPTQLYSGSS